MATIYDLSWGRSSFLAKLQLFFRAQYRESLTVRSNNWKVQVSGYSSLSSTYYSIAGTAMAKLRAIFKPNWLVLFAPVRLVMWLPLGILGAWCYWRMSPLSDRAAELAGDHALMTTAQLDVRQSILRRRGRCEEARACIRAAFSKKPREAHTRGLLLVGMAEIDLLEKDDWQSAEKAVGLALAEAEKAEKENPRQAVRIYRKCADLTDLIERGDPIPGSKLRRKAKELADELNLKDQLLKL